MCSISRIGPLSLVPSRSRCVFLQYLSSGVGLLKQKAQVMDPIPTKDLTIDDVERMATTTRDAMLAELLKMGTPNGDLKTE